MEGMRTLEEGAKMLLVAWVKNWTMRTLLGILYNDTRHELNQEFADDCAKNFPFMPNHIYWYASHGGAGLEVRRFVAEVYPKLNDRLWDLKDPKDCLKHAEYVQKQKAKDIRAKTKYGREEIAVRAKERREYRASNIGYRQSREAFKKYGRSAWTTVKAR